MVVEGCIKVLILVVPLTVLKVVSYDLTCPENLHRTYRIRSFCNATLLTAYSCLLDKHTDTFKESCEDEINFVRPGQRYVINGFRTNTDCSESCYQPFKFWSQKYSKCVFFKSLCNGIGQLLYECTSTTQDNKCGCDHSNGYAFLVKPKNTCYCVPTEQDCTCFKKKCPPYTSLIPGLFFNI
ncbi:unnamed protein product [Mytilus coruscus]|uniref:BPTI/Kunitz inhibitor domain-containing protein n=1 Tax=Mytilus coruscus TaxID=42192 RepID=A0A6J8A9A4_MYTCO|nr:unnamed protein product [Mytilus coruscus]